MPECVSDRAVLPDGLDQLPPGKILLTVILDQFVCPAPELTHGVTSDSALLCEQQCSLAFVSA